ncbi:uncharacterized protein KY384_007618 [Bacidia gigantensis]|uniref:uncharacterized protein n=1 Tax=Bacidia gigantensis TaxID=2732470 RepID=UPI001D043E33|nr:uncharacterized protein KY384_007618 [Bacidia gigantensis]KAG8527466.1 hypothetical protein KY384_007618 [Bacidia gigantensis]
MHYHSLLQLLATITFISTAFTKPLPQAGEDHSKIHRVPAASSPKNGVVALCKAYSKYGWTLPPKVAGKLAAISIETSQKAAGNNNDAYSNNPPSSAPPSGHGVKTGTVSATLANDNSEYLIPVQVGSQTLHMNLDTGSSDLWVFSTELESHERGSHTLYQPPANNHIKGASFNVSYGDDTSLTGSVAFDTVSIGGISVGNQALELPTDFSAGVLNDPSDGIIGLGFQSTNSICTSATLGDSQKSGDGTGGGKAEGEQKAIGTSSSCPAGYVPNPRPTWFENARSGLVKGVFTANLKFGTPGYFGFGSIDHIAYKGDEINYVPVDNSRGFWGFRVGGYRVGGGAKGAKGFGNVESIADSGSSLLMLEPEVAKDYYGDVQGAVEGDGGWVFPCGEELPDFGFTVGEGDGGYEVVVEGKMVNYAPTSDGKSELMSYLERMRLGGTSADFMRFVVCYGGIQSNGGQGPQIFGDIMFKSQFVVFDYDGLRLGLAPHA